MLKNKYIEYTDKFHPEKNIFIQNTNTYYTAKYNMFVPFDKHRHTHTHDI